MNRNFDKYKFRKEIIKRLKSEKEHIADVSDIVNGFMGNDADMKKEVERELVHLTRNMKILDVKEWEADPGKMNDDWLANFKKCDVSAGGKIIGLYASLTKDYFVNQRQKSLYYLGIGVVVAVLLFWAIDKFLTRPS